MKTKEPIFHNLELLNQETQVMYESLKDMAEEDLHDQRYGWSIIQVFSHLNMAEFGSLRYMNKKMQAEDKMPEYAISHKVRYFLTKRLLQSSLKWKAPKVVADPKGDYSFQEMKEIWAKTRSMIETYISEYPEKLLSKAVYKHPFAGRLDLDGAVSSFVYHQRHHVHQIKRIRKEIGK